MGCSSSKPAVPGLSPAPVPAAKPEASSQTPAPAAPRATAPLPPLHPHTATSPTNDAHGTSTLVLPRDRFASYASGASTPDLSDADANSVHSEPGMKKVSSSPGLNKPLLIHSTSAIGLDEMIDDRREGGTLRENMVHIEVPFGKPIEEVYEGVHNGPVLGSGISGLVRLVTHKATGLKYAVKVLDLGLVETAEGLRQLRNEIFIMCQLDHPNVVRLEEVYESHSEIYLVQELCLGGELFDRLDEQPDYHYTEAECARLVKQMLSAVRYLHSKGIIHRDLKLENFLFSDTTQRSELKMIDFGLSKHFRYGEVQHEAVGTPYTVAPEVIKGSYDERCDIWAIGVIAFLLLSGDPPFGGCGGPESLMQVRANILSGQFEFEPQDIWDLVSEQARQFITDLLITDPTNRPTARAAQKHGWLQEWARRDRKSTNDIALNPNVVKALVNFKEYSDMRKLLCEVLSFTLLPEQIKDLRREFEKMDTDGSGEISLSALKQVLMTNAGAGSLGALTEEEVTDIFDAMRVRKTETRIHWHEFIAAGLSQCQVDDRNLRLAFERLDADHKGYITLDDIMDLIGSDALQSEEAMRQMWGDSVKAIRGQHARITYDDFLLLMKGQSREGPTIPISEREATVSTQKLPMRASLSAVPEGSTNHDLSQRESDSFHEAFPPDKPGMNYITLPSGDKVSMTGDIISGTEVLEQTDLDVSVLTTPDVEPVKPRSTHSAPTTPAQHKTILGDQGSPLSMDTDEDITSSGPGVPGSAASLTPPTSPQRGAKDFCTPMSKWRSEVEFGKANESLMIPGLPPRSLSPYQRGRSRSMGNGEDAQSIGSQEGLHVVADHIRDMMLPETDNVRSKEVEEFAKDPTKSNLKVNRKLYRAHRQMRLAVLEASKRFEEQQARHAKEMILAQRADEEKKKGMIQAGLVMRHGHKKQVSSEAIRSLLEDNAAQQRAMIEKANRLGGRGRRSRKKTISDMSGMLSSMGSEELGPAASKVTAELLATTPPILGAAKSAAAGLERTDLSRVGKPATVPAGEDISTMGTMPKATVPGDFKKTADPFSSQGLYGAMQPSWKKSS